MAELRSLTALRAHLHNRQPAQPCNCQPQTFPTHLAKAELRDAFMRRMHLQCRVTRGHQQVG